jgi:hypothetical protein
VISLIISSLLEVVFCVPNLWLSILYDAFGNLFSPDRQKTAGITVKSNASSRFKRYAVSDREI